MKKNAIIIVSIIVVIGVLWYAFDYRSGYPKGPAELGGETVAESYATSTQNKQVPAAPSVSTSTTTSTNNKNFMNKITIETSMGKIVFETYDTDAPKAVNNFVTLANKGFYNGVIFHRVISGFMIQGGDPTGTGMGGPGYKFDDELNPNTPSYKAGYVRGTVAMANSGPNTNGSQFFIMHRDTPLPNNYTIFGKVVSGMEVVDAIAAVEVNGSDKPLQNVTMNKVTVEKK